MKTTQQTISRWESGVSRPRSSQMALLARVLKTNVDELLLSAGYTEIRAVISFDQPFPLEALSPDSFERFCFYFLAKLHPSAEVHRVGGPGHAQEGVDIDVVLPDKTCLSFQCKRIAEFGPQKIHAAVAKHTRKANKKFILLSRVASPQARQAMEKHAKWQLWDREDISRRIRDLAKDDQRRLVDTFFPGQRLALLGITESGPWKTTVEFYAPFAMERAAFNHTWRLVGRTDETSQLLKGLSDNRWTALFLVGAGGIGKSRVLKQVVEEYEAGHKDVLVRFLSPSDQVTQKSLEDLGSQAKVLVVDDAHDREDLQLLFQFVSDPSNFTKIVCAFRPYGLGHIEAQASVFSLTERVLKIELKRPTPDQATALATQVLERFDGPVTFAEAIGRQTCDSPLATVLEAQIVAVEQVPIELAENEDTFKTTLLGKFRDIIAGKLGDAGDTEPIKKLLRILALFQPFNPDDASLYEILQAVEGLDAPQARRLIGLLSNGGVLFRRSGLYRLSPDVLAEFIIEDICIGESGVSTGYAEKVFDAAPDTYAKALLHNLGKLDWIRTKGNSDSSRLLDAVWGRLSVVSEYDPHIAAVASVAYYQPKRALEFVDRLIREGKKFSELPDIVKNAAYNLDHLRHACECLWELGKDDQREPHQYPGHAIRILADLCAVESKPIQFNEIVVDFGLFLLRDADSWEHKYSPFDFLKGILRTEGDNPTFKGGSITFRPFTVKPNAVSTLRYRVVDATIALLSHPNLKVAVLAASFLAEGLRYPVGLFGTTVSQETLDGWTKEFSQTLEKVEQAMVSQALDPIVVIEILRSVSWHAHHANGTTTSLGRRIFDSAPNSIDFRTTLALIDGYGHLTAGKNFALEWDKQLEPLVIDLLIEYPDGEKLRALLADRLTHIRSHYVAGKISPHVLCWRLLQSSPSLAKATVESALADARSATKQFAGAALSVLLSENRDEGLAFARRFLELDSPDSDGVVAEAFGRYGRWGKGTEDEYAIIRSLLNTQVKLAAGYVLEAVRQIANKNPRLAIELLKSANIGESADIADEVFMLFEGNGAIPFALLLEDDAGQFLAQLDKLPALDGYWIQTFLSHCSFQHAAKTARFFMNRVSYATSIGNWDYRPCNYGPYINVPLRFRQSTDLSKVFQMILVWMREEYKGNFQFLHLAAELFAAMFLPFDGNILTLLDAWIEKSTLVDIQIISEILRHANPSFVFEYQPFVIQFLEIAKRYGDDALSNAVGSLWSSAITGTRMGSLGEPFQEDIVMKEKAARILQEVPRFSPAYGLYEALKKTAQQNIERSRRERERLEE